MAKYKGKDLSLTFEGDEVNLEATSVLMDREDADTDAITFAELADGTPSQWFFAITAVSDYGESSFWTFCWDNAGEEVDFIFKPYGNATASASQPHFTGTATVNNKPPVGGEAGSVFTFETRFDIVGAPVRDITP
jgi:hypothetical protein